MTIPGLLVEYLIVGILTVIWCHPILLRAGLLPVSATYVPMLVAGAYVAGMLIDFYAFVLLRPIKRLIRARVDRKYAVQSSPGHGRTPGRAVKLSLYSSELAREVGYRSSRDRIARGLLINSLIALAVRPDYLPLWFNVLLAASSLGMWILFEYLSYSYELKAEEALAEKLRAEEHR